MTLPSVQRKLAAIFSADVQGYSRLMGDDEVATVRTLTAYRGTRSASENLILVITVARGVPCRHGNTACITA